MLTKKKHSFIFNSVPYKAYSAFDLKSYRQQMEKNYASINNPFSYYQLIIDELAKVDDTLLLPLFEFNRFQADGKHKLIGLRHDIDADPFTAVKLARFLAQRGLCGSFYFLHTALYYGNFYDDVFVRNPELSNWIYEMIVAGAEIGLHNDALMFEKVHGMSAADVFLTELAWLRNQGAVVRGTVAHNSFPIYQAENFEIFKERLLWNRKVKVGWNRNLNLGALSEKELGLEYEGTFSLPLPKVYKRKLNEFLKLQASLESATWMKYFLYEPAYRKYSVDLQCWLIGRDSWVISGNPSNEVFQLKCSFKHVLEVVRDMPSDSKILLVVHPCYVNG